MRTGKGTLSLANGDKYIGEFKKNMYEGEGIFISRNGDKQQGLFKNNQFVGDNNKQ